MKYKYLLLIILFAFINPVYSQEQSNTETGLENIKKELPDSLQINKTMDTLCFKYHFQEGDSLIYKITSNDSLIHNMDKPLKKRRVEHLLVVCDSVDIQNHFHLTLKLLDTEQKEWNNDIDTAERKNSVWIGKRINLIIDSLGNRIKGLNNDSSFIAGTLGGAFQPYLFFSLGETCKLLNTSWLISSSDTLYENAYPPAHIAQTSLIRAKSKFIEGNDTLIMLTFVKTAKGLYGFETKDISVSLQNIMNIYGEITISLNNQVPITYFTTQEEKIHLIKEDGTAIPSWHYSTTVFELETFKRSQQSKMPGIPKIKITKKKKNR